MKRHQHKINHGITDAELIDLLWSWRDWSSLGGSASCYNSKSSEYALMVTGTVIQCSNQEPQDDDTLVFLDGLIARMPKNLKKIIKLKYLFGWRNKDAAHSMNVGLTKYKETVIKARKNLLLMAKILTKKTTTAML